jgi:hypothetical protein
LLCDPIEGSLCTSCERGEIDRIACMRMTLASLRNKLFVGDESTV